MPPGTHANNISWVNTPTLLYLRIPETVTQPSRSPSTTNTLLLPELKDRPQKNTHTHRHQTRKKNMHQRPLWMMPPEQRPEETPHVHPRAPLSVPPAAFPFETPLRGPAHPPRRFEDVVAGTRAESGNAVMSVWGGVLISCKVVVVWNHRRWTSRCVVSVKSQGGRVIVFGQERQAF